MSRVNRLSLLMLASLLAAPFHPALAGTADHAGHDDVVQRIVLMRHGIRSPTKAPDALANTSADPWPAWPVAPGQLTPHGIDTLRSLGRRMAVDLADAGLPASACMPGVVVIADTTPRNRASAGALLEGLSPGCPSAYRAFPTGQEDPLFHGYGRKGGDDDDKGGIAADGIDASIRESLAALQQVLLGCRDDACLGRARQDGKQVLLGGDEARALKTAGSLAENIMLAYVQGMPPTQFGWNRLDAAGVARIIGLHNRSFQLAHATPEASRARGGNMLAHIAATLAATATPAGGKPHGGVARPLAAPDTRVVLLIGHDTDLAAEAGLLGLHWHDATQGDDYPPGGALVYDLVQTTAGKAVRLSIAMPTLAGLRAGDLGGEGAIVRKVLAQPACDGLTLCPVERFAAIASRAVGNAVSPAGDEPAAGP